MLRDRKEWLSPSWSHPEFLAPDCHSQSSYQVAPQPTSFLRNQKKHSIAFFSYFLPLDSGQSLSTLSGHSAPSVLLKLPTLPSSVMQPLARLKLTCLSLVFFLPAATTVANWNLIVLSLSFLNYPMNWTNWTNWTPERRKFRFLGNRYFWIYKLQPAGTLSALTNTPRQLIFSDSYSVTLCNHYVILCNFSGDLKASKDI